MSTYTCSLCETFDLGPCTHPQYEHIIPEDARKWGSTPPIWVPVWSPEDIEFFRECGRRGKGLKRSEETKAKMRKPKSAETRAKMSATKKKMFADRGVVRKVRIKKGYASQFTPERRKQMSEVARRNTGWSHSPEARAKMSAKKKAYHAAKKVGTERPL